MFMMLQMIDHVITSLHEETKHRFHVRHLHGNFKKKIASNEIKFVIQEATKAITTIEFEKCMKELKRMDEKA